jgi:hypothetical protein
MKLFQKADYYEGEKYPENVILSWGRKYDAKRKEIVLDAILGMTATGDIDWVHNGFYIKFEAPFTFTTTYLEPSSFLYQVGKVRPTALWARRKKADGSKGGWFVRLLKPLNPESDPLHVEKNVEVFGPHVTYSNYIGEDTAEPVIFKDMT